MSCTSVSDENGRVIAERYFGTDFAPVLLSAGYAAWEREYDERGNVLAARYFGTDGLAVKC